MANCSFKTKLSKNSGFRRFYAVFKRSRQHTDGMSSTVGTVTFSYFDGITHPTLAALPQHGSVLLPVSLTARCQQQRLTFIAGTRFAAKIVGG